MTIQTINARMNRLFQDSEKNSIDINYQPQPLGVFENEKWHEMRKTGFGGSDAGIVEGVNKYENLTTLVMKKLGMIPDQTISPEKQFMFDFGHVLEDALGYYFHNVTGWSVFADHNMFRHPLYPWMIVDCDAFAIDSDGMKCLLEFKTCSAQKISEWRTGIYGKDGLCPNPSYVSQMKHGLAVMNLDRGYWIVCNDNDASKIVIVRYDRDFTAEAALIKAESKVWNNYVAKGIIPQYPTVTKESFDIQRDILPERSEEPFVIMPDTLKDTAKELMEISSEKSVLLTQIKKVEERANALKLDILSQMGSSKEAHICSDEKNKEYVCTYKSSKDSVRCDLEKLRLLHPEIFDALIKESIIKTETPKPIFRISLKMKK